MKILLRTYVILLSSILEVWNRGAEVWNRVPYFKNVYDDFSLHWPLNATIPSAF